MRERWATITLAAVVAVVLMGYLFVFQVRVDQIAVHYRLGKKLAAINEDGTSPGWHFQWPFPVDDVIKLDRRVFVLDSKLTETFTKDEFNIIPQVYLAWRIRDGDRFVRNFGNDPDAAVKAAETQFGQIANASLQAVVGKHYFDNLLLRHGREPTERPAGGETVGFLFEQIETSIGEQVAGELKRYGCESVMFGIQRVALPDKVTQDVLKLMKQERSTEAERYRNDGKTEAAKIVAAAQSEAQQIIARGKEESEAIRAKGDQEEGAFYATFAKNPPLHSLLCKLRALRQIAENLEKEKLAPVVVFDTTQEPFDVLRSALPPDKQKSITEVPEKRN